MDRINSLNKDTLIDMIIRWKMGIIEDEEFEVLNDWYNVREGALLEHRDELTMEKLEKRLHEQFYMPQPRDHILTPPWESLKNKDKRIK